MEIGIYIAANIISSVRAIFGRLCRLFLATREVAITLFTEHISQCSLATSRRCGCAVNNLFSYSFSTQRSRLPAASWSWKLHIMKKVWEIRMREANAKCSHNPVRSSSVKKWGVWIGLSPARLCPIQCKNWHALHKSSYCYHMKYTVTRNLN